MVFIRNLLLYITSAFVIGFTGLALSYRILSSRVWFWAWDAFPESANKNHSSKVKYVSMGMWFEAVRLIAVAVFFFLWTTLLFHNESSKIWGHSFSPLSVYNAMLQSAPSVVIGATLLFMIMLIHHFISGPILLKTRFNQTFKSKAHYSREVFCPYAFISFILLHCIFFYTCQSLG